MACRRCGQCCTLIHFCLGGIELAKDSQEFARYVSYHRCEVFGVDLEDGRGEVLGVKIPLTCQHLEFDGNTGLASCAIYETRPQICKDHQCNFAKGE